MSPQNVISNFKTIVTKKFFCFEGRAGRAEFWLFFLAVFIVNTGLGFIPKLGAYAAGLWMLAMLFPMLGAFARRLHDRGKTGWVQLVALIPLIGGIILLLLCIPEGEKGANRFGEPV